MIDVSFDFTTDSPGYWDDFWNRNDGLGAGGSDPDIASPTLQEYHRILWSRELPNGQTMVLKKGIGSNYLTWNGFRFGSDSITATFRYKRYRCMLEKIASIVPAYHKYVEDYLHRFYTIGGMMIFPKRMGGINQSRGCNIQIKDRWDLTLECIRRYYRGEQSPLYNVLAVDKPFFDLFADFKGFVDYFFLQDCVSDDYESVIFWEGGGDFRDFPFPQTVDTYINWIDREIEFVEKRNERIKSFIEKIGI